MKRQFFVILLCGFFSLSFSACRGGLCAGQTDAQDDVDSDCEADDTDNCIMVYNPQQFDGDDDGVGAECDADDNDEGVASISAEVLGDVSVDPTGLTLLPDFSGEYFLNETECTAIDATLAISQSGTSLTLSGDINGTYTAELHELENGRIVYEANFVDGTVQYGLTEDSGEIRIINVSGATICVSYYGK